MSTLPVQHVYKQLEKMYDVLSGTSKENQEKPQLPYLKAVAMVRCILVIVSDTLARLVSNNQLEDDLSSDENRLVELVEKLCCDARVNSDDVGPSIFLLRQIYKRFGSDCLKALAKNYTWVLPKHLVPTDVSYLLKAY